jgi:hypothetical protein
MSKFYRAFLQPQRQRLDEGGVRGKHSFYAGFLKNPKMKKVLDKIVSIC